MATPTSAQLANATTALMVLAKQIIAEKHVPEFFTPTDAVLETYCAQAAQAALAAGMA